MFEEYLGSIGGIVGTVVGHQLAIRRGKSTLTFDFKREINCEPLMLHGMKTQNIFALHQEKDLT